MTSTLWDRVSVEPQRDSTATHTRVVNASTSFRDVKGGASGKSGNAFDKALLKPSKKLDRMAARARKAAREGKTIDLP
jgi:hypothetical protein